MVFPSNSLGMMLRSKASNASGSRKKFVTLMSKSFSSAVASAGFSCMKCEYAATS